MDDNRETIVNNEAEEFSYEGYQVVRREFFSHIYDPSITFNQGKIYVNKAALKKLPDSEFVQILIHPDKHRLVINPCDENAKDSFAWKRENKHGVIVPKQVSCKIFFGKIFDLMNWNPDYRYKLLGKLIRSGDDFLFVFDLNAAERYERLQKTDGSTKRSRIPIFPAEWKNQFGLSVEEHSKQLQVNIFEGYAVFDISKKNEEGETEWQNQTTADQPSHSTL